MARDKHTNRRGRNAGDNLLSRIRASLRDADSGSIEELAHAMRQVYRYLQDLELGISQVQSEIDGIKEASADRYADKAESSGIDVESAVSQVQSEIEGLRETLPLRYVQEPEWLGIIEELPFLDNSNILDKLKRLGARLTTLEEYVVDKQAKLQEVRSVEARIWEAQSKGEELRTKPLKFRMSVEQGVEWLREKGFVLPKSTLEKIVAGFGARRIVILRGAPRTGKTKLACLLPGLFLDSPSQELCTRVPIHPESSAYDIIGGLRELQGEFVAHFGYLTESILKCIESNGCHWLIMDEINRGDVNAILGPVHAGLCLDDGLLEHPHLFAHKPEQAGKIPIPGTFRIVGTMNSFDENQLFRLSDALLARVAFVELKPLEGEEEMEILVEQLFRPLLKSSGRRFRTVGAFTKALKLDQAAQLTLEVASHLRKVSSESRSEGFTQCEVGSGAVLDIMKYVGNGVLSGQRVSRSFVLANVDAAIKTILLEHMRDLSSEEVRFLQGEVLQKGRFPECWQFLENLISQRAV